MKRIRILVFAVFFIVSAASQAWAVPVLVDWAFNVDGDISIPNDYDDNYKPIGTMPTTGALNDEGLGTLTWTTSTAGDHLFIAFFDHDIDASINTYFNEYGAMHGTLAEGQSCEIDIPTDWDIYDHLEDGALINTNGVPEASPDDVSWAMGWDFTLAAGETATISLILGRENPGTGFYLSQTDPDSNETIYFSSSLETTGSATPIPEPGTLVLLGAGLLGILGVNRKKKLYKPL